ncbi:MAG TPA: hypothetical protein EYP41_15430 [Anaerolineae bacterium]|nr:hypothetical protein [Anaerolineae bacterium]
MWHSLFSLFTMTEHNTIFDQCEVAIIGGGPIGVEMAITLERLGVDYIGIKLYKPIFQRILWDSEKR